MWPWCPWTQIGGDDNYKYDASSPTEKHTTYNAKYAYKDNASLAVERTFVLGVNASYKFSKGIAAMIQADYVTISNYGNIPDVKQNDFQLVAGVTFSF